MNEEAECASVLNWLRNGHCPTSSGSNEFTDNLEMQVSLTTEQIVTSNTSLYLEMPQARQDHKASQNA